MIVMFHGNKTRKPRKSKHEQKHLGTIFIIAPVTKGGFFQKVRCVFEISKSPKKYSTHYPELEIYISRQ